MMYGFEGTFLLHAVLQFFTEYYDEIKNIKYRKLIPIMQRYIKEDLIYDAIPLLPFQFMTLERKREQLFYLIKFVRLFKGMKLFNITKIMLWVKAAFQRDIDRKVRIDRKIADDFVHDNTKFSRILIISYTLKISKLMIIVMNVSFLLGMLWMIN